MRRIGCEPAGAFFCVGSEAPSGIAYTFLTKRKAPPKRGCVSFESSVLRAGAARQPEANQSKSEQGGGSWCRNENYVLLPPDREVVKSEGII